MNKISLEFSASTIGNGNKTRVRPSPGRAGNGQSKRAKSAGVQRLERTPHFHLDTALSLRPSTFYRASPSFNPHPSLSATPTSASCALSILSTSRPLQCLPYIVFCSLCSLHFLFLLFLPHLLWQPQPRNGGTAPSTKFVRFLLFSSLIP